MTRRSLLLAGAGLALPGRARAAGAAPADALYERTLAAYRGALSAADIEAHAEQDPGPSLYLGPRTPGEWGVARLFASLPDAAHAELRRTGLLKWRFPRLPETQRGWLRERIRQFERRGDGPYPLEGAEAAFTGFTRVELEGLDGPQFAWFLAHAPARRDNWQTLVRVRRILSPEYDEANRARLKEVAALAETPPIPRGDWQRVKDPPPPPKEAEPKPEPLMDEKRFRAVVKAFRGDLGRDERALLAASDPLLARRLRLSDPADTGPQRLLGRLSRAQLDALLYTGRVLLRPETLTAAQRDLLTPTLTRLNAQARDAGAGNAYELIPYGRTVLGFAFVLVPEVPEPALSWWIRTPLLPVPAWVTLTNDAVLQSPHYFRAHLDQLQPAA